MAKITLDVADELVKDLGRSTDEVGREILLAAAFHWCRRGDLATSKAAQLAGVTYADFLQAAAQRHAILYDYDPEEIDAEIGRRPPEGLDSDAIKQESARAPAPRG
jgi:predicted HTH domain antitoxin